MNHDASAVGRGRIVIAVALLILAIGLCIAAVIPTLVGVSASPVSLPDFFLAVGASAAVAAVFFFLSAQIKRSEVRSDEAIGNLRQELSSLAGELYTRAAERAAAAQKTADAVADGATTTALLDLSKAASERGLGSSLCVALRGRLQLSLQTTWAEGYAGPVQTTHRLGVEEVPSQVKDPGEPSGNPAEWHRRQLVAVELPPTGSLEDALAQLHEALEREQASWSEFPEDAEHALGNLGAAMRGLFQVNHSKVGVVDVVLDKHYVLTRPQRNKRLLVDVRAGEHLPITPELAMAAGGPAILHHQLIQRHLEYQRAAAREGQQLLDRKRASGAVARKFRSGP